MGRVGQGRKNFLLAIDPLYDKKVILPHEVGPEHIAATRPDAVVLKNYLASDLGKILERVGIKVVYVSFETPRQYERDIKTIGELFQNEKRAEEVSEFFRSRVTKVKNALAGLEVPDRPTVLLLSAFGKDCCSAFNVPSSSWMQTALIEIAGGTPVWKHMKSGSGWTKISFEQIAAWDPEYIFITAYFLNTSDVVESLRQEKKWSRLSAVKNERFCAFPADYLSWDQPDTRWILGLTWCAKKIHPLRFREIDMMEEVKTFYRILYRIDEASLHTEVLPLVQGDAF
jgi:iron complex transport system substrate-binding protein